MNFISDYMGQFFEEVTPYEFYRDVFPVGELEERGKQEQGKYNGVAVELLPREKGSSVQKIKRYIVTDDLYILDKLLESDNFIIISPISYKGKNRKGESARFIYGLALDLDGVETKQNIIDLFYQMQNDILPTCTYAVTSGHGLHLYYLFETPLPAFENIKKGLHVLKMALIRRIWNRYITVLSDKPQYQSIFQGFRLVGGVTKDGRRTQAYRTGKKINVEYLNNYVTEENQLKEFSYKSKLTLSDAKKKYPEWYERRIEQGEEKGTWVCKRALYDWWKRRLLIEATEGHRYFSMMCLAIYAKKSGVSYEELEKDAFELVPRFDLLTTDEKNHFTDYDCIKALEMYNDSYFTFPIEEIVKLTLIPIEKNKRNYRKRAVHIEYMNMQRTFKVKLGESTNGGRPKGSGTAEKTVKQWQQAHPDGKKADCIRETGLSKKTVYKWWT